MTGNRPLITLCEGVRRDLRSAKRGQINIEMIAHKFAIDEKWVERNEGRFEFVRNEAIDFCDDLVTDAIHNCAPEKSANLYFWAGFVAGILLLIAFNVGGVIGFFGSLIK